MTLLEKSALAGAGNELHRLQHRSLQKPAGYTAKADGKNMSVASMSTASTQNSLDMVYSLNQLKTATNKLISRCIDVLGNGCQ